MLLAPQNRARVSVVVVALLVLAWHLLAGCAGPKGPSDYVHRAAALAFNGAAVSLEFLDATLSARLEQQAAVGAFDELPPEELERVLAPWAERVVELERARAALGIARAWLAGERQDGAAALRDAARALRLVAEQLEADGVEVPERVRDGIQAAELFTAAELGP